MSNAGRVGVMAAVAVALLATGLDSLAQSGFPNPYRPVKGLADGGGPFVPGGEWASRPAGPPPSVFIDAHGGNPWAVIPGGETNPGPVASRGGLRHRLPGPGQQDQEH